MALYNKNPPAINALADPGLSGSAHYVTPLPELVSNRIDTTYVDRTTEIINNPGGNNNQIQYAYGGEFKGDNGFVFDPNTKSVYIRGNLNLGGYIKGKIYTNPFNFHLTGGSAGDVLSTDGAGNLYWGNSASLLNYSNTNVGSYLTSYSGNLTANNVTFTNAQVNNTLTINGNIALDVSQLHLAGGTNGQYLKTFGNGTVAWSTDIDLAQSNLNLTGTNIWLDSAGNNLVWGGSVPNAGVAGGFVNRDGSNTALMTFSTDGGNVMSINVDGSIFAGDTFESLDSLDAASSGWIVAANGVSITNTNGRLKFPDGTTQYTAYPGVDAVISQSDPGLGDGRIWFDSVEGRAFIKYNGQWVDMNPEVAPNPNIYADIITFSDGSILTSGVESVYANSNVANYMPTYGGNFSGNIVSANKVRTSDIYNLAGVTIENSDLTHNATAALILPTNGSSSEIELNNTYGPVSIGASGTGVDLKFWNFGTDGTLTTPGNISDANVISANSFKFNIGNVSLTNNGEFRMWAQDTDITVYRNGQDGYAVKSGEVDVYASNQKVTKTTTSGLQVLLGNVYGANTVSANYFVGNGSLLTGLPSSNTDHLTSGTQTFVLNNDGSFGVQNSNTVTNFNLDQRTTGIDFRTNNGTGFYTSGSNITFRTGGLKNWIFDNNGNLTTQGSIKVGASHGNIVVGDATATGSPGLSSTTSVTITANRDGTATSLVFGNDGSLIFPQGDYIKNSWWKSTSSASMALDKETTNYTGRISINNDGSQTSIQSVNVNSLTSAQFMASGSQGNAGIITSDGTTSYNWIFDLNGNTTLPGNLNAVSSSPAPSINGFDSAQFAGNIKGNAVYTDNYFLANGAPLPLVSGSSNVTTTGNVSAGNVIAGNFSGNGSQLTSISGANVIGTVANANYSAYAGNALQVSASNITGIVANASHANIADSANSVAVANVTGLGNIATINLNGNASQILYGNGIFATAPVTYSDSNVASYLTAHPQSGTYSNSNVTTLLASFGSNTIATTGNVSVGNITATNLGNLSSLNKDGNASNILYGNGVFASSATISGNYGNSNVTTLLASLGSNSISTTGNVTAAYFIGNGSQLTGLPASYANSNVATFLANYGSNTISTTGNITAGNLIGNISITGNVTGTSPNVTILSNNYSWTFDQNGNMTMPNIANAYINGSFTNGNFIINPSGTGDVYFTPSTQVVMQDTTAATSTTTGALIVSGGAGIAGNLFVGGNVSATYVIGNGSQLTGLPASYANSNVASYLPTYTGNLTAGNISGTNVTFTGNLLVGSASALSTNQLLSNIQQAPSNNFISNAHTVDGGSGGNYLGIGQYPAGANLNGSGVGFSQWLQSGYSNVSSPVFYPLVLNPMGGNVVLGGNLVGNTNGYAVGYRDLPQIVASNTTLAATDGGKHYYSTTAGNITLTIPNNATTSFSVGTAISIVVQAAGNILVNASSGVTLYMAGNSTSANRYVNAYGMATLLKVGTDTWFINGTGVN